MQVSLPIPAAQATDLAAAVTDAPAATPMLATLAAGYVSVHWSAAGSLPAGDDSERFNVTTLPAVPVLDISVKED
jgi:hypothetical protein